MNSVFTYYMRISAVSKSYSEFRVIVRLKSQVSCRQIVPRSNPHPYLRHCRTDLLSNLSLD
jgi:hypothetical protein